LKSKGAFIALAKGLGNTVAKVETRLGVDALAIPLKGFKRKRGETHIMRNDRGLDQGEEILEITEAFNTSFGEQDMPSLPIRHGADKAVIRVPMAS
jgi:hypothetical protein